MRGTTSHRFRSAACALAGLLVVMAPACTPPVDLEPVPHPEPAALGVLPTEVGAALEARRGTLEALGRDDSAGRRELAEAYGALARLYQAYRLYEAAAACYRNASALEPGSFEWAYLEGSLQQALGANGRAATSLRRALGLRADDGAALLRLGDVEAARGEVGAAIRAYEAVLAMPEYEAAAERGLGRLAVARGDTAQAVEHFERALALQPEATVLHYPLGQAYRRQGDLEAATRHLALVGRGALVIDDPLYDAVAAEAGGAGWHMHRAVRALAGDRFEQAIEEVRAALAIDPAYPDARRSLGIALLRQGDPRAAIAELEAGVEQDPADVWLWLDLGNARLETEAVEGAIEAFRAAITLVPEFESARFNLASAIARLGRWQEVQTEVAALLEVDPRHAGGRYLEAMADARLGRPARAMAELESLLEDQPDQVEARRSVASMRAEAGDLAAARDHLQLLEGYVPMSEAAAAWRQLAAQAGGLASPEAAVEALRRAAELEPESLEGWTRLAEIASASGQHREAAAALARAVELTPEDRALRLKEVMTWVEAGDEAQARARLERGVGALAGDPWLTSALARLLATASSAEVRDGALALALANSLYQQKASFDHAETLAMALAETGRFPEAARVQRQLIEQVASGSGAAASQNLERLRGNLALYDARRPVRMR